MRRIATTARVTGVGCLLVMGLMACAGANPAVDTTPTSSLSVRADATVDPLDPCGGPGQMVATAGSPEYVALEDYQAWYQFPSRALRAKTVLNDGSFARVEVCAEVRHGYTDVWEEFSGEYDLALVNGRWSVKKSPLFGVNPFLPVVAAATKQALEQARTAQISAALAARSAIKAEIASVTRTKDPVSELVYWTADIQLHSADGLQHAVVISPTFTATVERCEPIVSLLEGTHARFMVSFAFGTKPRLTVSSEPSQFHYAMDADSVTPLVGLSRCALVSNPRDLQLNFEEVDGISAYALTVAEHEQPALTVVPARTPAPSSSASPVQSATPVSAPAPGASDEHSERSLAAIIELAVGLLTVGGLAILAVVRRKTVALSRLGPVAPHAVEIQPAKPTVVEVLAKPRVPLQVKCLGGAQVTANGRVLWPSGDFANEQRAWELLLYLAASNPDGVDRDVLGAALWREVELADVAGSLRQLRRRLRTMLVRAVPDLPETTPFAPDTGRIYRLDRSVIASDVHTFVDLQRRARSDKAGRLGLLEQAFALYEGDLFDTPLAPPFSWAIDPGEDGTSLRQQHQQEFRLVSTARRFACAGRSRHLR